MAEDELKRLLDDMRQDNAAMRQESASAHEETRRLFAATADRLSAENRHFFLTTAEGLRHEIQLVAEGVSDTREALSRETADIRDEMRRWDGPRVTWSVRGLATPRTAR